MSHDIQRAKKAAAYQAVLDNIDSNMTIAIGTGATVIYVAEKIAQLYHNKQITNIKCIPTSYQSQQLIIQNNLPLGNLSVNYKIDIDFDGVDEIDNNFNIIKGGGGCHLREKMIATNSKKFIIVTDWRKKSDILGNGNWKYVNGIPVSFIPESRDYLEKLILKQLNEDDINIDASSITLRMAKNKAGPVVTEYGNFIFDIKFDSKLLQTTKNVTKIDMLLHSIPGVVETGFFVNMADLVYIGQQTSDDSNIRADVTKLVNKNARKLIEIGSKL